MQELIAKRDELFDLLETELKKCESSGVQLAENEAKYRMKLRLAILDERMNGTPVSIISDLCRGKKDIAELRRLKEASEAVYWASFEAINVYKLRIKTLNDDIARIWSSGGRGQI